MERESSPNEGRPMKSDKEVEQWFREGNPGEHDRAEGVFTKENPMTEPVTVVTPDTERMKFIREMAAGDQQQAEEVREKIRKMLRKPEDTPRPNLDETTLADIEREPKKKVA